MRMLKLHKRRPEVFRAYRNLVEVILTGRQNLRSHLLGISALGTDAKPHFGISDVRDVGGGREYMPEDLHTALESKPTPQLLE